MGGRAQSPVQRRKVGYILRATGWLGRLIGGLVLIAGLYGMTPGYRPFPPFSYWRLNLIERLPVFMVLAVIGGTVVFCSFYVGIHARRHLVRVIESPASLLPGTYVLYLRPFRLDADTSALDQRKGGSWTFAPSFNLLSTSGRTHEEQLARMFREFGPVVAVGRPEERLPLGSGAQRIYIPRQGWEPIVSELIDNARLVIIGAGPGKGTAWEYVEVMRRRDPSRLLILVTDRDGYRRFKASSIAEAEGVLLELQSRYGSAWQAPILPDLPLPATKSSVAFFFIAMLYFGTGWEPHMTFFDRSEVQGGQREADRYYKAALAPVIRHFRPGAAAPSGPAIGT
jgi:hypothetical protein